MSKAITLRVKLEHIGEVQEVGNNGFKKREVIGVVEGEYPDHFKFEFSGQQLDAPTNFLEGTYANISFNLRGRKVEKEGRDPMFFVTFAAWKIEG